MKFNIWDITKSIAVIVIIAFLWMHGTTLVNHLKYGPTVSNSTQEKISDNAIKITNVPVSKKLVRDLIKELKEEDSEIVSDNKHIIEVGKVEGKVRQKRTKKSAPDKVYENKNQDPKLWYSYKEITAPGYEDEKVAIAWARFFPNQDENKKWDYGNFDITAKVNVVRTENRDGKFDQSAEVNIYGKDNKRLHVEGVKVDWAIKSIKDKGMYWWNPRLGLGTAATSGLAGPRLDFSIASYGRTKVDMDWRFLTLGVGYHNDPEGNKNIFGVFEPVSYNVGKVIPVVENLFLGATITHDGSDVGYGLGVSVPF